MKTKDWYTAKHANKRALRNRALRQAKWQGKYQTVSPAEEASKLVIYEPDEVNDSKTGILAELKVPNYSIFSDGRFVQGRVHSKEQGALLDLLVVGDNVVFELSEHDNLVIEGIVARRSKLVRLRADASRASLVGAEEHIIAANIDMAVIVASTIQPPFHPRLVDRYLIMCQYGGVKPLLCLTKTDLAPAPDLSMYSDIGIPVVCVSNKTHEGISELMPYLEGKSCVLVGHSGVGKSSLINTLLRKELLVVRNVSEKTGKGKHTSTTTSLHFIDKSTFLIDTPGIRALGLWNIDKSSLKLYFPEFGEFAKDCEFRDCSHSHEPKCAVKKAVEENEIPQVRYDSYIRLLDKG